MSTSGPMPTIGPYACPGSWRLRADLQSKRVMDPVPGSLHYILQAHIHKAWKPQRSGIIKSKGQAPLKPTNDPNPNSKPIPPFDNCFQSEISAIGHPGIRVVETLFNYLPHPHPSPVRHSPDNKNISNTKHYCSVNPAKPAHQYNCHSGLEPRGCSLGT